MADIGQTYTDPAGPLQQQINDLTNQVTTSINNAPQVRQSIGQAIQNTQTAYQPEADERAALVKQLFDHDQNLASRYSNNAPTNNMYIENPLAQEVAIRGAEAPLYGSIDRRNANLSLLKSLFGDAISRGMELYNTGIQAKQTELDNLMKQLDRMERKQAAEEDKRRWEQEFALRKQEAAKSGAGVSGQFMELPVNGEVHQVLVNPKDGSIIKDFGASKKMDVAGALQKLREQTKKTQPTQNTTQNKATGGLVLLYDPKTKKTYSYEGKNDPDYITDVARGFVAP